MKFPQITFNLIMYILIFAVALIVYIIEQKDWKCDNAYEWWSKCHEAEGMPYRGSKPDPSDSCQTLLKKINIAAKTEQETIKWRRALFLAVLISFLVFVLIITPGKLPGGPDGWTKFSLVVLVVWASLYFNFNNYAYHKYKKPQEYIEESTKLLQKYCT